MLTDSSSLFDFAVSLFPSGTAPASLIRPTLPISPNIAAVMYQSGGRSLRGYGFPGDSSAGAYPLMGGMHPGGMFGGTPQPLKQREISFDTSSKEPHLIRARVFVGNINTSTISREDIIRLFASYGNLLGVTLFKGYAFIQYANSNEADLSVSVLNGHNWNGTVLDVKLAIAGMKSHNAPEESSANGVRKRGADSWLNMIEVKKERVDVTNPTSQNERNRTIAESDETVTANLYAHGMSDTLICGCCRFVTSDFEQFREHRKVPCAAPPPAKDIGNWPCSMCNAVCDDACVLIEHARERHNIRVKKGGE